jgi:hypothetical protein
MVPVGERGSGDDDYDIGEGLVLIRLDRISTFINPGQGTSNSE